MIIPNKPKVGDIIRVKITGIVETIGAFAKMPNGQDGLIRLNDFAWFNQTYIFKSGKTKCARFEKRNVQKSGKTKRSKKIAHTTL